MPTVALWPPAIARVQAYEGWKLTLPGRPDRVKSSQSLLLCMMLMVSKSGPREEELCMRFTCLRPLFELFARVTPIFVCPGAPTAPAATASPTSTSTTSALAHDVLLQSLWLIFWSWELLSC
jgi:hypothetical protein